MNHSLLYVVLLLLVCSIPSGSAAFNRPEYNQANYLAKRRMHADQILRFAQSPQAQAVKLVSELCPHVFKVLHEAKKTVEFVDMESEDMNDTVGGAFAMVFENTPFLLEWALLFPDTVRQILADQPDNVKLLQWAIQLTRDSGLLPEDDVHMFEDAEQELNFVPRKPGYRNPYTSLQQMMHANQEALYRRARPETKVKKRNRGPRLTSRREEL